MATTVTLSEVRRLIAEGVQLVEVLPAEEYRWAHLPGAELIELKHMDESAVTGLDRGLPVVVYCNDFP